MLTTTTGSRMQSEWALLLLSLFLVACSSNNTYNEVYDRDGNERSFDGITDVIDSEGNTNILFIHGMGGYSKIDDDAPIDPCEVINRVRGSYDLPKKEFLYGDRFCEDTFTIDEKTIHLRSLQWSQVTSYRKSELQNIDQQHESAQYRIELTKSIKYGLINEGFADALLYAGSYRESIQKGLLEQYRAANDANSADKIVIVTFSLGSSIFLDSLKYIEDKGEQELLKNKVSMVYMMANQVPLIRLASEKPKVTAERSLSTYEVLAPYFNSSIARESASKSAPHIQFVAFSDPNDLLSYPIDEDSMGNLKANYVNVIIPAAKKTYKVPFFPKYSFVNYEVAHIGYVYSGSVMKYLLNGNSKD